MKNTLIRLNSPEAVQEFVNAAGRCNFDIDAKLADTILKTLEEVAKTVDRTTKVMLHTPTVISRLERTGVVSNETARSLGAVGMAARASGVDIDSRFDLNDSWYTSLDVVKPFKATGDVYSRFKLRYKEI